jgi:hypothetical protein
MGLYKIKKHLNNKENNYQKQETAYKKKNIFANYSANEKLISRVFIELKK